MDYVAPIYQGDKKTAVKFRGYIAIQLKQEYTDLVPQLMFNKPSPAAYYGVFQGEKPLFTEHFTNKFQNGTNLSEWEL